MNKNSLNNLRPIRTKSEARTRGKNGGIKSGRSRRQKKAIREYLRDALNSDIPNTNGFDLLKNFFPDTPEEEFNVLLLGITKMVKEFVSDDIKPMERIKMLDTIAELLEEKRIDETELIKRNNEEFENLLIKALTPDELHNLIYSGTLFNNAQNSNKGEK